MKSLKISFSGFGFFLYVTTWISMETPIKPKFSSSRNDVSISCSLRSKINPLVNFIKVFKSHFPVSHFFHSSSFPFNNFELLSFVITLEIFLLPCAISPKLQDEGNRSVQKRLNETKEKLLIKHEKLLIS